MHRLIAGRDPGAATSLSRRRVLLCAGDPPAARIDPNFPPFRQPAIPGVQAVPACPEQPDVYQRRGTARESRLCATPMVGAGSRCRYPSAARTISAGGHLAGPTRCAAHDPMSQRPHYGSRLQPRPDLLAARLSSRGRLSSPAGLGRAIRCFSRTSSPGSSSAGGQQQEAVEAALLLDRAQRAGGDPQAHASRPASR